MKKLFLFILAGLFLLGGKFSFAQEVDVAESAKAEAVSAGNKICPVSGEKINEKDKATYEYKGKIYNFCCLACIDEFKKDPEKYIKKVEEELKASHSQRETIQNQPVDEDIHGSMHEHHHH